MPRYQLTWQQDQPQQQPLAQVPLLIEQMQKISQVLLLTVKPHLAACETEAEKQELLKALGVNAFYAKMLITNCAW